MSAASVCDRCDAIGKYDDDERERPKGWVNVEVTGADDQGKESVWIADLCPDCAKLVHELLDNTGAPS